VRITATRILTIDINNGEATSDNTSNIFISVSLMAKATQGITRIIIATEYAIETPTDLKLIPKKNAATIIVDATTPQRSILDVLPSET
jgi:hypothetical protein